MGRVCIEHTHRLKILQEHLVALCLLRCGIDCFTPLHQHVIFRIPGMAVPVDYLKRYGLIHDALHYFIDHSLLLQTPLPISVVRLQFIAQAPVGDQLHAVRK